MTSPKPPHLSRVPSPRAAVYTHRLLTAQLLGLQLLDALPVIVQSCSPNDSPKASCLKGEMLRSEVRVFKGPRPRKWDDWA